MTTIQIAKVRGRVGGALERLKNSVMAEVEDLTGDEGKRREYLMETLKAISCVRGCKGGDRERMLKALLEYIGDPEITEQFWLQDRL